jgi:hypothetical protein
MEACSPDCTTAPSRSCNPGPSSQRIEAVIVDKPLPDEATAKGRSLHPGYGLSCRNPQRV